MHAGHGLTAQCSIRSVCSFLDKKTLSCYSRLTFQSVFLKSNCPIVTERQKFSRTAAWSFMNREMYSVFLLFLIIFLFIILAVCDSFSTSDDAFISFRYARNLAHGHGLVFNPGERVEGYTNFLWTILISLGLRFVGPVLFSKVLGVICSVLLIIVFQRYCWRRHPFLWWGPVLYLALDPGFIDWSTRGLETSLFTLLFWFSFQIALQQSPSHPQLWAVMSGLIVALTVFTRPEGALAIILFPMVWWARSRKEMSSGLACFSLGVAALLGPYLLWKYLYFGNVVPNTFYAKTGGGSLMLWRGVAYILQGWGWPEAILLGVVVWGFFTVRHRVSGVIAGLFAFVYLFYVGVIGGDSLGVDRFLVPILPFVLYAAFEVVTDYYQRFRNTSRVLLIILPTLILIVLNALPLTRRVKDPDVFSSEKEYRQKWTRYGRCLGAYAEGGDSVATSVIGRVSYYSNLYIMDVFGLIDPYIAHLTKPNIGGGAAGHEKSDWDYILSRRPTFITGRELIIGPPSEPDWFKKLRIRISGDHPVSRPGIPPPPYPGYERIEIPCEVKPIRFWRRIPLNDSGVSAVSDNSDTSRPVF